MNNSINELKKDEHYLKKILETVDTELAAAPQGNLRAEKRGDKMVFFRITSQKEHQSGQLLEKREYIKKEDQALVSLLAQKSYNKKMKKAVENNLNLIQNMLKRYDPTILDKIYDDLPAARKALVVKHSFDRDTFVYNWEHKAYTPKGFEPNDLRYETDRGEIVRSKSERDIANYYYRHGIPYKYECPVTIHGITFYPDFTVLNVRTCKQYYHEHFGMLGDFSYVEQSVMKKINMYAREGIILGENFFFTGEIGRQTFNIKDLEIYVKHFLL